MSNCNSTFSLSSDDNGNLQVNQATFKGGNPLCPVLSALQLPWPVSFNSITDAVINNVQVKVPMSLLCSGNVQASIANSLITLSGPLGLCSVSGTLEVTPKFTVVD